MAGSGPHPSCGGARTGTRVLEEAGRQHGARTARSRGALPTLGSSIASNCDRFGAAEGQQGTVDGSVSDTRRRAAGSCGVPAGDDCEPVHRSGGCRPPLSVHIHGAAGSLRLTWHGQRPRRQQGCRRAGQQLGGEGTQLLDFVRVELVEGQSAGGGGVIGGGLVEEAAAGRCEPCDPAAPVDCVAAPADQTSLLEACDSRLFDVLVPAARSDMRSRWSGAAESKARTWW